MLCMGCMVDTLFEREGGVSDLGGMVWYGMVFEGLV